VPPESVRVLAQLRVAAEMAAWAFALLDAPQWTRTCL